MKFEEATELLRGQYGTHSDAARAIGLPPRSYRRIRTREEVRNGLSNKFIIAMAENLKLKNRVVSLEKLNLQRA